MQVDTSRNYMVWTNTEAVRLESLRKTAPDSATFQPDANPSILVTVAKRRAVGFKDVMAGVAAYGSQDAVWLLPAALTALTPKRGDVVVDMGGDRWTVLEAQLNAHGATWRLPSRNLVLAEDLRDTITIERCAVSYDSAGVKIKAWPTQSFVQPGPTGGKVLYQVPGKAQTLTVELADQRGIRGAKGSVAVVVGRQVIVDPEQDRVRLPDGTYLDILGYHDPDRIDVLPVIDCERRP